MALALQTPAAGLLPATAAPVVRSSFCSVLSWVCLLRVLAQLECGCGPNQAHAEEPAELAAAIEAEFETLQAAFFTGTLWVCVRACREKCARVCTCVRACLNVCVCVCIRA